MCRLENIVRYELSLDSKGLLAYFKNETFYHIHSNELTELEKWIHSLLMVRRYRNG